MMSNVTEVAWRWFKIGLKKSQFNKDFTENYNEDSDEGYFPKVNVQYLNLISVLYLPFLPARMKVKKCHTHKKYKTNTKS